MDKIIKNSENLIIYIGFILLGIGIILLCVKSMSPEYIDQFGILHESFYLLPISFGFSILGIITIVFAYIKRKI